MPIYEYECEKCGERVEHFFDMNKRKKTVKCEKCGATANRVFSIGAGYVKHNYVGDIWEKTNAKPVSDKNHDAKMANRKRVKKMREKTQSRIDKAREKRRREGKE